MNWQPGQRLLTVSDHAEWQTWRKARRLEQQRQRRARYPRIDYYPSNAAQAAIYALTGYFAGGDYSTVIDKLVLATAEFPELIGKGR